MRLLIRLCFVKQYGFMNLQILKPLKIEEMILCQDVYFFNKKISNNFIVIFLQNIFL